MHVIFFGADAGRSSMVTICSSLCRLGWDRETCMESAGSSRAVIAAEESSSEKDRR